MRHAACILTLALADVVVAQPDEGLVLHYAFDEGAGEVVRDQSGNGLDGRIVHARRSGVPDKAEWVREGNRKVLRLDGWTHIEAGTKVNALMGDSGTLETWCLPEEIGGGLIAWTAPHTAGAPYWPDQRLVLSFWTYRDSRLAGVLGNGVENTRNGLLHPVEKGKWGHLAMTFDGAELRLFVNGEQVSFLPQTVSPDFHDVPLRIGQSNGLGGYNLKGRMAEVRIYDRALSVEELARHFVEGVKRLGIEIPVSVGVTTRLDAKRGELTVLGDLSRIPDLPERSALSVQLRDAEGNVLQDKTTPIPESAGAVAVALPTASLAAGLHDVSVAVKDMEADKVLIEPTIARWYFPETAQTSGTPPARKVLNNLVTQLISKDNLAYTPYQEVPFINPRKGWVFVSTTVKIGNSGLITVAVDTEAKDDAFVHCTVDKPTTETMRFLSAGEHTLGIWSEQYKKTDPIPTVTRLVVRAVPAMMICGFPGGCYVSGYTEPWGGYYSFAFLQKDVLPNLNTFVGQPHARWNPKRAQWKRRGGRWLLEQPMPDKMRATLKDVPTPLTGDYAYDYWTKGPGFTRADFDGVMADEVSTGDNRPDFQGYIEAVKRIAATPAFRDKAVHMWGGAAAMCVPSLARDFLHVVMDSGYALAPNTYLSEAPTVEQARALLDLRIRRVMERAAQARPGLPRHVIMNLGFNSVPPWTADLNPHVDYKVFLDMQFQHLAVSPECCGLWGVMMYKMGYADEETLRWTGRLFRHYCIEGNTSLLSGRYGFTYNLRHIHNADFNEGSTGWMLDAAEPGSLTTGTMRGLHQFFGRYHGANEGNDFLLMKRSTQRPNRVSQDVLGLQPGWLYSMKLFAADHRDLVQAKSEQKRLAASIAITNTETIVAKSFVSDVRGRGGVVQYRGKEAPFMNYHRRVFRANGATARLTISDWANETTPGGPIGQETLVNFIEIQPYLE